MNLISEGLGLKCGYFDNDLTGSMILSVNHYPPCPEPSLTLGMSKHSDPNLITILMQDDVSGLQVLKDGKWIAVEVLPHSFVINVGYTLQVLFRLKFEFKLFEQFVLILFMENGLYAVAFLYVVTQS
jgi:isopenicillin N synthase-like dioxygenase